MWLQYSNKDGIRMSCVGRLYSNYLGMRVGCLMHSTLGDWWGGGEGGGSGGILPTQEIILKYEMLGDHL